MAIRITENGAVNYENSPDVNRKLFPNLNVCGKEIDELAEEIDGKAPAVFSTASGSIASFSDGADDMPLKSCVVSIEPIQEGSGDPSPENVRPISGRTGLSVVRSGKNLIDFASVYDNIQTITFSDGVWTGPGNAFWATKIQIPKAFIGKTLVFSAELTTQGSNSRVAAIINGVTKNGTPVANADVVKSVLVITPVSENDTIWINYSSPGITTVKNPQLEFGSEATDYEPYKGSTYSVNWETEAGTVYGGILNIVSGKLTVDRAKRTFTGEASENWHIAGTQDDGYFRFYTDAVSDRAYGSSINGTHLCNYLKPTSGWAISSSSGIIINNPRSVTLFGNMVRIYLNMSEIISELSVTALNTYLAEHPLDLCYLLATPIEIQLTPQEIRTLLGENNIWSDAGDVSVEFPADTKTYIDDLSIKAVEVSGQTPTITAEENARYICGEVTSLTFTPCETGICDVRFTAASISTVLTLPETVKLPDWFDPTLLEAGTTYEINVLDGIYGVVMSWA